MSHSIFEDLFVFVLILAGAWCVQYSFASLFDTLINDCLPEALGYYTSYYHHYTLFDRIIQVLPFAVFYALICFLICTFTELAVSEASHSLYNQKKLKKYCLDDTHQAFFTQLLSFVIILITPGWLSIESVFWKFGFLIIAGGFAISAYLFLCLLASFCNANGVRLLWGLVAVISFIITWIISGKLIFSLAFILISLFMIPFRDWIFRAVDHVFDERMIRILGMYEDDEDMFDDEDDLPF